MSVQCTTCVHVMETSLAGDRQQCACIRSLVFPARILLTEFNFRIDRVGAIEVAFGR